MTMLSFRVEPTDADLARDAADALKISQSQLFRDALRHYLNALAVEREAAVYESSPLRDDELALIELQHWPPAEDWSDWADAPR